MFEEFIRERIYLKNITPNTEKYHRQAYASYERLVGLPFTKANLNLWIVRLRESGVKPVSCESSGELIYP